jgi:hypothetical protein
MGMLGTAAEVPIRAAFEKVLPDRCSIIHVTAVKDATGGWTSAETTYASGIPCRVDDSQTMSREQITAGRQVAEAPYFISLSTVASRWPGGVISVTSKDKLVVTGDGAGTYEATAAGGPSTDQYLRAVPCTRIG